MNNLWAINTTNNSPDIWYEYPLSKVKIIIIRDDVWIIPK